MSNRCILGKALALEILRRAGKTGNDRIRPESNSDDDITNWHKNYLSITWNMYGRDISDNGTIYQSVCDDIVSIDQLFYQYSCNYEKPILKKSDLGFLDMLQSLEPGVILDGLLAVGKRRSELIDAFDNAVEEGNDFVWLLDQPNEIDLSWVSKKREEIKWAICPIGDKGHYKIFILEEHRYDLNSANVHHPKHVLYDYRKQMFDTFIVDEKENVMDVIAYTAKIHAISEMINDLNKAYDVYHTSYWGPEVNNISCVFELLLHRCPSPWPINLRSRDLKWKLGELFRKIKELCQHPCHINIDHTIQCIMDVTHLHYEKLFFLLAQTTEEEMQKFLEEEE